MIYTRRHRHTLCKGRTPQRDLVQPCTNMREQDRRLNRAMEKAGMKSLFSHKVHYHSCFSDSRRQDGSRWGRDSTPYVFYDSSLGGF